MNSDNYRSFDDVISNFLYNEKELKDISIHYEQIFGMDAYYYECYRLFHDIDQCVAYNILTDMVEYICESVQLDIKFGENNTLIPTHFWCKGYPRIGYMGPPYENEYVIARSEYECKRVLRAIYWMLFTGRYQLSSEDRWYLKRKYWTQKVFEFENKMQIVPDYIYRFYNTILLFDKYSSKIFTRPLLLNKKLLYPRIHF